METPVGNPNVSLLPQPATPAPIEAMRGGAVAVGGGPENVSLLPQPAVPAPIEAMRGGGPENVSLLPQPATPSPIEPMKGGGDLPLFSSVPFYGEVKYTKPAIQRQILTEDVKKYVALRTPVPWPKISPNMLKGSLEYEKDIDENTFVYVYHVTNIDEYLKIEKRIYNLLKRKKSDDTKHDFEYLFIIYLKEPKGIPEYDIKETFNEIMRLYMYFVISLNSSFASKTEGVKTDYEIYMLHNQRRRIGWKPNPRGKPMSPEFNSSDAAGSFQYVEPESICLKFKEGKADKKICFLGPGQKKVRGAVNIVGSEAGDITKKTLSSATSITEPTEAPYYFEMNWVTHYLLLSYTGKEPEDETPSLSGWPGNNNTAGTGPPKTPPKIPPSETKETPATAKKTTAVVPPQPKRVFKIQDTKTTVPIDLGDQIFLIRKYDEATEKEWEAANFTPEETKFFEAIGFNKEFLDKAKASPSAAGDTEEDDLLETRKLLVAGRGELLKLLTTTTCLNTTEYMLKSECEFMREFLQNLLYVRQIDRIQAITAGLSGMEDFLVSLDRMKEVKSSAKEVKGIAFDVLTMLDPLLKSLPRLMKTKVPAPYEALKLAEMFSQIPPKKKPISISIKTPSGTAVSLPGTAAKTRSSRFTDLSSVFDILTGLAPSAGKKP